MNAQIHPLEGEDGLVLANQTVPRFGEDPHQGVMIELVEVGHDRDPADELGNHAVLDEVLGVDLSQELGRAGLVAPEIDTETHPLLVEPVGNQHRRDRRTHHRK